MGIFFVNEYTSNDNHNYGVPELKQFPLDTNEDIQKAIKNFHKCPNKYKEELAINITRRMINLDNTATPIDPDKEDGEFYKYYKKNSKRLNSISIQEKALSSQERKELSDSEFGIPELRKYPLTDKEHVEQAIRYFNKCPKGYEKELASNIKKKIIEYNMKPNIGDNNNFKNYYNESTISSDITQFLKGNNDDLLDPLPIEQRGINIAENTTIITEESNPSNQIIIDKPKNGRKYKCPYCNSRYERAKLVTHIDKVHEDMIPEGYTAARIVFNMINHKEVGHCVVCGKETEWNENTWRYERFCSEKCVNEYKKTAKARMVKKYGKEHLLNDMEQQKKMLSNRRISGEYKWSDGELREYVGSYEKKLLEFLDKVMHYKSSEVITPGPTVDYEYEGKIHHWILDMYIVPSRLAIDVKDGGDNPNNRDMPEYRAKQVAKEKAIKDLNKFNYLRLTNNNFTQLLELLVELKENLKEDDTEPIIRIHEFMAPGAIAPTMGLDSADGFIVPCKMNNTFVDYVYTTDKYCQDIYKIEDNKIKKISRKELESLYEIDYLLKYNKDDIIEKNRIIKESYENNIDVSYDFFQNVLVGNNNDIIYDNSFDYTLDGVKESKIQLDIRESTFNHQYRKALGKDIYFPILKPEEIQIKNSILNGIDNIDIMTDKDGYFLIDKKGDSRTLSFDKLNNIDIDYLYTFYNMLQE